MSKLEDARNYEKLKIEKITSEKRPVYHLTPNVGWMNDPNGFSLYNGEYHLFYQYYPYDIKWGEMYWGHAKATDFIKWERLLTALAPEKDYETGCFSGSGIETNKGQHLLMYTAHKQREKDVVEEAQCIALGDGVDYTKYENNPIIHVNQIPEGFSKSDFRDPKIWEEEDGFYAIMGGRYLDGRGAILLYYSKDAYTWSFLNVLIENNGEYGNMWECPDFFELDGKGVLITSPMEMRENGLEFFSGNTTIAAIGDYDKLTHDFSNTSIHTLDYGLDFYAPQTLKAKDGRRILIGWMQCWENYLTPKDFEWSGMTTIPREVSIINNHLCQLPVKELNNYHSNMISYTDYNLKEANRVTLPEIKGRCLDLFIFIKKGQYNTFILHLAEDDSYHTSITINKKKMILTLDRSNAGMQGDKKTSRSIKIEEKNGSFTLRILLDRYSMELFVNDGEYAMSSLLYTPGQAQGISFTTDGNLTLDIKKYDIIV